MDFSLVDLDGSTVDTYPNLHAAREGLRTLLGENPNLGDELLLVAYEAGARSGPPVLARDFLRPRNSLISELQREGEVTEPDIKLVPERAKQMEGVIFVELVATWVEGGVADVFKRRRTPACC